jgi:hypothetical protein
MTTSHLNTSDDAQQQQSLNFLRQRLHQARALDVDPDPVCDSLIQDLEHIAQWGEAHLHNTPDTAMAGVALFACSGADMWIEFPSPLPFDNEWTIADRPALRQLARLDADYTNALVVLAAPHSTRVYEVVLGGLMATTGFDMAPASRVRYQRAVGADVDRHYHDVAAYLAAYIGERPDTVVLVSGEDAAMARLRQALPRHVQQRILDTAAVDLGDPHTRILEVARHALEQHERVEDQESIQSLLQRAGQGSLAVVGLPDTLVAVNAGRVETLILHDNFQAHGWRCHECDNIDEGLPPHCPLCGGRVMAVELGEAMVSAVLQADGVVEPVAPDARLVPYDGVGALLRRK